MKIYILFIDPRIGNIKCEGIFSSEENTVNEVEEGENYAIMVKDIDCVIYHNDMKRLKFITKEKE